MVDIIQKARVRMVMHEPFYATLLMSMETKYCEVLPLEYGGRALWLAATDGSTLFLNPENVRKEPLDKIVGLLKHEIMHVALLHNYRTGDRQRKRSNKAQDYVINDMIIHEGGQLPDGGLHDPNKYGRDKAWEEVYDLLPPDPYDDGSGGGSGGGSGDPFDGDVLPAQDQSPEAKQAAAQRVIEAAHQAKARGNCPAWVEAHLGDILNPKQDWREQMQQFLTEVSDNDYTFQRPNRRFLYQDLYLPGPFSEDAMGKLAIVFDTSGSVSPKEIQRFASEVMGMMEHCEPMALELVYCDMAVQHHDSFDSPDPETVRQSFVRHGAGGTDMTVALDYLDETVDNIQACVVFTDGYTPFGNERDYPVLWAITSPGVQADMGQTLYVEV